MIESATRVTRRPRRPRTPFLFCELDEGLPPPLKWAGGKRWLVPRLKEIWEPYRDRRLVEPLCGGLAVTLGLMPRRAMLSDINPHPINFYRWLKKGLVVTLSMKNEKRTYYACRERFNRLIAEGRERSNEAAQLFYYLNRTGYNGLCRFNRSGLFNVPFGRYKTINYAPDFLDYKPIFAGWTFQCGSFESVPLEPGDFIYADPPYDVEFTQYSRQGFAFEDQRRLAEWLSRHSGPVVLSNQATPRILSLYRELGFEIEILEAPRMISCTGDRTPAREVLAKIGV
jgi:DNA adenine methylase